MKIQSPLLGFNNNVRHKGRVFHIQTEDSGLKHPHIITHLFADGGRILKTTKTSYAEHVGSEDMADTVRALMKEQHKAMFIALRDGQFDHLFDEPSSPGRAQAPGEPAKSAPASDAGTASNAHASRPDAAERGVPKVDPPPQAQVVVARDGDRRTSPTAVTAAMVAPTEPMPPAPGNVDLDLEALERAASEAQTPFVQPIQDLPPPPAAVLGGKRKTDPSLGGSYRNLTPEVKSTVVDLPPPPLDRPRGPSPDKPGRYAPSRPAAIFANSRPAEGASIFGEDLISEKSLDEVILSYLAEDLDAQPPKK